MNLPVSLYLLVVTNLLPLAGVLLLGWQIFAVMLFFWLENYIIGFFFILRLLTAHLGGIQSASLQFRLVGAIFFTLHFGIFTYVHGGFVFALFGSEAEVELLEYPSYLASLIIENHLLQGLVGLLISHGISYVKNFLIDKRQKGNSFMALTVLPYKRVLILHLTIIFGGMVVVALNKPIIGIVALVLLKILIDGWSHLIEHGVLTFPYRAK